MSIDKSLKALSDKNRREILTMLKKKSMTAGDIAKEFDMSQATVSYHLSILLEADLVFLHKEKNYRIYSLNTSVFEELMAFFLDFIGED